MDEFLRRLEAALRSEFGDMLRADDESWKRVAAGISVKMGVTYSQFRKTYRLEER